MDRTEAETVLIKFMLNEEVDKKDLYEAICKSISDMHKMAEIEVIVK